MSTQVQVLVVGTKKDGGDAIRDATRLEHLRYMIEHQHRVTFGGSFEAPDGTWGGMALVIGAVSLQEADDWVRAEPYHRAGLFETVSVSVFRQMNPEPVPGLLAAELRAEEERFGGR